MHTNLVVLLSALIICYALALISDKTISGKVIGLTMLSWVVFTFLTVIRVIN